MRDGKMRGDSPLFRRKQFEASEKERRVALFGTMIRDFDNMIANLEGQIAAEEARTRIKDTAHPAYSTFAKAAARRRQNLLVSVAHIKSMLGEAKLELNEVMGQLRDLESIQNNQAPPVPASSTPETISPAR